MTHQYPYQGQQQPQPGWGPPPAQTPPPRKKDTGKIIAGVVGGIFLFIVVLATVSGGDEGSDTAKTEATVTTSQPDERPKADSTPAREKPAEKPAEKVVKEYTDGDYEVGVDIQPGTYVSTGAAKGIFEFCSATTKPTDNSMPELESANAGERVILTVGANSGVVSISGCEPFKRR